MEENRWSVFDGEVRRRCLGGQSLVIRDLNLYDHLFGHDYKLLLTSKYSTKKVLVKMTNTFPYEL
jgi:hypothetical protein